MRNNLLPIFFMTGCLAIPSFAADSADAHRQAMDTAQALKDDLQEALNGKTGAKAADTAQKLAKILQNEVKYWTDNKQADALKLAQSNAAELTEVTTAAKANKMGDAKKAFAKMSATCDACHELHPEKRLK